MPNPKLSKAAKTDLVASPSKVAKTELLKVLPKKISVSRILKSKIQTILTFFDPFQKLFTREKHEIQTQFDRRSRCLDDVRFYRKRAIRISLSSPNSVFYAFSVFCAFCRFRNSSCTFSRFGNSIFGSTSYIIGSDHLQPFDSVFFTGNFFPAAEFFSTFDRD